VSALTVTEITPIGSLRWRTRAHVSGHVRSMRIQPWGNIPSLECLVVDESGGVLLVFIGRRKVAGIELGRGLAAEGMVGQSRGYMAILSPEVELLDA